MKTAIVALLAITAITAGCQTAPISCTVCDTALTSMACDGPVSDMASVGATIEVPGGQPIEIAADGTYVQGSQTGRWAEYQGSLALVLPEGGFRAISLTSAPVCTAPVTCHACGTDLDALACSGGTVAQCAAGTGGCEFEVPVDGGTARLSADGTYEIDGGDGIIEAGSWAQVAGELVLTPSGLTAYSLPVVAVCK